MRNYKTGFSLRETPSSDHCKQDSYMIWYGALTDHCRFWTDNGLEEECKNGCLEINEKTLPVDQTRDKNGVNEEKKWRDKKYLLEIWSERHIVEWILEDEEEGGIKEDS